MSRPTSPFLTVESLEDRTTPATIAFAGGAIVYTATAGEANNVSISSSPRTVTITDQGAGQITVDAGSVGLFRVSGRTVTYTGTAPVTVNAGDMNDKVVANNFRLSSGVTVSGGTGNDFITGSGANDSLSGDDGNDTLNGGGGDDTLLGGNQDDTLNDTFGTNLLLGGAGIDTINGVREAAGGGGFNGAVDGNGIYIPQANGVLARSGFQEQIINIATITNFLGQGIPGFTNRINTLLSQADQGIGLGALQDEIIDLLLIAIGVRQPPAN